MLKTKLLAVAGLFLTLSSLFLGVRFWGYERAVLVMQAGGFALSLGLFFRLTGSHEPERTGTAKALSELYDMESFTGTI